MKTYQTPQHIIEEAFKIQNKEVENGRWYDEDGVLLRTEIGTKDGIKWLIPPDFQDLYAYGKRLHNHPNDGGKFYESFSIEDIQTACEWLLSEELVITKNSLYSMRPPISGWGNITPEQIYKNVYETLYGSSR